MAGQAYVQDYLRKHKIGALFEDLMAKVIKDLPDDPLTYLSHVLERKGAKKSSLRKSTGDLSRMRNRSPEAPMRKSMSGSASAWASSDGLAVAKDRKTGYEKPWQTNTKRLKPKKSVEIEEPSGSRSISKQEWDNKPKKPGSFDDLWNSESRPVSRGKVSSPTRSPTRHSSKAAWADDDEDLLFRSYNYKGPRRHESTDPLAGEFSIAKYKEPGKKETSVRGHRKQKNPQSDSRRHKEELAKMIQQQRRTPDSGYEDEREIDKDDAVEMMENLDDLRREGARNVKGSGVRMSRTMRRNDGGSVEPQVRVSICARCARVMTGDPSEDLTGDGYGELPDKYYDTDKEMEPSRPVSGMSTQRTYTPRAFSDDEEFESVSQVTGPRRPVWQNEDSDGESRTPRKGKHMFSTSGVPSKGRPMYSGDAPAMSKSALKGSARRSEEIYHSRETPTKGGDVRSTWSPGMEQHGYDQEGSPTEGKEVSFAEGTKEKDKDEEQSAFGQSANGWTPQDYDTDGSSVDWNRDRDNMKAGVLDKDKTFDQFENFKSLSLDLNEHLEVLERDESLEVKDFGESKQVQRSDEVKDTDIDKGQSQDSVEQGNGSVY